MYTRLELPAKKLAASSAPDSDVDEDVVRLEPYIVLGERDSLAESVRKQLERPRLFSAQLIRGVPKMLGSESMIRLPVSIGLASEASSGAPRDAPGGGIPLGLILATPTISRDLAGWFEKNFMK